MISITMYSAPTKGCRFCNCIRCRSNAHLNRGRNSRPRFSPKILARKSIACLCAKFYKGNSGSHAKTVTAILKTSVLAVERTPMFITPNYRCNTNAKFRKRRFFRTPSVHGMNSACCFICSSVLVRRLYCTADGGPAGSFICNKIVIDGYSLRVSACGPTSVPATCNTGGRKDVIRVKRS